MGAVKRPQKPKPKGLTFSSTTPKRKHSSNNEPEANEPPTKRVQLSPTTPATKSHTTTIPTTILCLSDTHGHHHLPHPLPHPHYDVLLHTGDLSSFGSLSDYHSTISLLSSIPASLKLVIAGNHDLTLDSQFWDHNCTSSGADLSSLARELWTTSTLVAEAGIIFLEPGIHDFALKYGARLRVYASPYTPVPSGAGENWAFGYQTHEDIYNPPGKGISYAKSISTPTSEISDKAEIDIIMTHGPPKYRLDRSRQGDSLGCPHLYRALRRKRPRMHCFGHVHHSYGAGILRWKEGEGKMELPEDDEEDDGIEGVRKLDIGGMMRFGDLKRDGKTVLVNAALMGDGKLENMPFCVEMELERAIV